MAGPHRVSAHRVALLGAESTGKTQLSLDLAAGLRARGLQVAVVAEYLREWCVREGRTPRPEEQLPIAQEQERRVDTAAGAHDVVIADTTSVMVAIYSAMLFADGTLLQFAQERLRTYHAVLVTGLDLPWVADGLQRDGPHVREPVDALVRSALESAGVPYQVVYGAGAARVDNAMAALARAGLPGAPTPGPRSAWVWSCEQCSDPGCEHRLFRRLQGR